MKIIKDVFGLLIIILFIIAVAYMILIIFPGIGQVAREWIYNLLQGNILALSPYGFALVVISGVLAFGGYVLYKLNKNEWAKICLNLSPIILFFGSILIESTIFALHLSKTEKLAVTSCNQTFMITKAEDLPMFATCLFTGYYPTAGVSFTSLAFTTFVIFFWLLPFAFLFAFLFGLFGSTFDALFGGGSTARSVTTVITFIVAMYGARQAIGAFLIDFFAYGSWGLVGIFIPLALAVGLKKILDWAIPVQVEEAVIWTTLGIDVFSEIARLKEELENAKKAIEAAEKAGVSLNELRTRFSGQIKAWETLANGIEEGAKKMSGSGKAVAKAQVETLRGTIEVIKKLLGE